MGAVIIGGLFTIVLCAYCFADAVVMLEEYELMEEESNDKSET